MNSLEKLVSLGTVIVADTGDIDLIKKYKPVDVTTNPSLILSVYKDDRFKNLLVSSDLEEVLVKLGVSISKEIEGFISTEVNPKFSYDTAETVKLANKIIKLYESNGIDKERVLIKIAATWEGIEAAKILESCGIKCNMTLVFSTTQALACAQANVTLISPFVGRITDWFKEKGHVVNKIDDDFGVRNLIEIFNYFRVNNYKTIIMGASFRNIDQIKALAGLDKLTISPKLLEELICDNDTNFDKNLESIGKYEVNEITKESFQLALNNNLMAKSKLSDGIKKFVEDTISLEQILQNLFSQTLSAS